MEILIGLGGNLGDPPTAFRAALEALGRRAGVVAVSALYRSEPVGPPQPRYSNQVVRLEVDGPLVGVLDTCQRLESEAGRDRTREQRWGPRPLDLDLLMAPGLVCRGPRLTLPHPRLHERAFALVPAAEIAPEWVHPLLHRTLADLARDIDTTGLVRGSKV
jgi:2-amino-4-hydroxy-6-hydroxymethyldihydropteridine diphosphokinase